MMDKTTTIEYNETGKPIKKANVKGISQTYLQYLLDQITSAENGKILWSQLTSLLKICLKVDQGLYCSQCGKIEEYEKSFDGANEKIKIEKQKLWDDFKQNVLPQINTTPDEFKEYESQFDQVFLQKAQNSVMEDLIKCPVCGEKRCDSIRIENSPNFKKLKVLNSSITDSQFDDLKSIILHYNISNYDGDKYIDPDLKEELAIKAKLKQKNTEMPNLEKQMACIVSSTNYTFESIMEITLRKLNLLLKTIDSKHTYYAQLQGQMSGMVSFKEDPKHWIYGKESAGLADELTDADSFLSKFDKVT